MKLRFTAEVEAEMSDSWLEECWEGAGLVTKEAQLQDALSCAAEAIRERIGQTPPHDPVKLRVTDLKQDEASPTAHTG